MSNGRRDPLVMNQRVGEGIERPTALVHLLPFYLLFVVADVIVIVVVVVVVVVVVAPSCYFIDLHTLFPPTPHASFANLHSSFLLLQSSACEIGMS